MTVRAGRSRFNLQTLAAADYPRISLGTEQLQTLSLPQKDLRSLFKLVEFAMAQQDIRYYLNGMLLVVDKGTLQAVATDGHRLSWASIAVAGDVTLRAGSDPAAQDGARAGQAARPTATTRSRSTSSPTRCASASPTSSWCRRSSTASFPDFNRVIPVGHTKQVELDRVELLAALQRAAILSNEKFRGVRVVLAADQLKIICTNSEQEEAEEELEVAYKGDPLDIGFNITYLLDALQNLTVEQGAVRLRRRQFERAGDDARSRRLQVRRHADAHLMRAERPRNRHCIERRRSRRRHCFGGERRLLAQ